MNKYFELPKCNRCDVTLEAKMYIEEEEVLVSHHWKKTGRIRQNVDYLFCPCFLVVVTKNVLMEKPLQEIGNINKKVKY